MSGANTERLRDPMGLYRLGYAGPCWRRPASAGTGDAQTEQTEPVVEETPVAIVYNGIPHVVMMATPADLEDFALGFSLTEELIQSPADLEQLEVVRYSRGVEIQAIVAERCAAVIAERTRRLTGRTGCGICGADGVDAVLKTIHPVRPAIRSRSAPSGARFEALAERQPLNAASGAVHAAGWARADGTLELVREDVGRHNALDKLVGAAIDRQGRPGGGIRRWSPAARASRWCRRRPCSARRSWPRSRARPAWRCGWRSSPGSRSSASPAGARLTAYAHPERLVAGGG